MLTILLALFAQDAPSADNHAQNLEDLLPPAITATEALEPRITWFTQWNQAVKEAQRLNRPILLQSAAPVCSGVPGMW